MTTLFMVGQLLLGGFFVYSGIMHFVRGKDMAGWVASRKLPAAAAGVYITGAVLILGGLGVMTQMYVLYAYSALIVFLLSAMFLIHNFWADTNPQVKAMNVTQFTKDLALAAALLMLLAK